MRKLNMEEIGIVSGAGETCDATDTSYIGEQSSFLQDFITMYEGVIASAVYVMERLDNSTE